ncbi:hypothetical protein D3C73_362170 [compost metagenome]
MRKVSEITSAAMAQKINIDAPEGMHMHPPATATKDGFMSKEDKVKLDAATTLPTPNTIVKRDASGNFQVGTSTDPNGIANNASVAQVQTNLTGHINDSSVHMLPGEKTAINNHMADTVIHITSAERTNWNSKAPGSTQTDLVAHTGNADIHTTATEKTKLAGIATGAEVNQNAFSYVNDVAAGAKTDTLFLVGGIGITVSTDPTTKKVTITATGQATPGPHAITHITGGSDVIPNAETGGSSGLMSGADAQFVRVDGETKTGAQAKADAAKTAAINAAATDATTKADAVQTNLNTHTAQQIASGEVHGIRVSSGSLQYKSGTDWVSVKSGVQATTAPLTYYINASTGSDSNDGLSASTAFQTIKRAIDLIPQIINHSVTINIASGTYNETVNLNGYLGYGNLSLQGANVVASTHNVIGFVANHCTCRLVINGFNVSASTGIIIAGCTRVIVTQCQRTVSNGVGIQFYASLGSVTNCLFSNAAGAISVNDQSTIYSYNNAGTNNSIGLSAGSSSTIGKSGTQPAGTTAESVSTGGVIRS